MFLIEHFPWLLLAQVPTARNIDFEYALPLGIIHLVCTQNFPKK